MPITQIKPTGVPPTAPSRPTPSSQSAEGPGGAFSKVMEGLLGQVNGPQQTADQAVRDLATGRTDNIHDVMLAVAKADLTFRMILEVRNRLAEGFQEVLRLQV